MLKRWQDDHLQLIAICTIYHIPQRHGQESAPTESPEEKPWHGNKQQQPLSLSLIIPGQIKKGDMTADYWISAAGSSGKLVLSISWKWHNCLN